MSAITRLAPAGVVRTVTLWLFVVFLGMSLGAGLFELRIEVPQWLEATAEGYRWNADAARAADTGRRFWVFVTTVPLTVLTVASLVLGWRSTGTIRRWWVGAAMVSMVDRLFTFTFFIPTMVVLMNDPSLDPAYAVDLALLWFRLDWVRQVLSLAAFLLALRALSLSGAERATTARLNEQPPSSLGT